MSAYAADILAIMDLYFKMPLPALPSIVLLLTTQCIGFGLAGGLYSVSSPFDIWYETLTPGMLQNLLVSTPSMYWPGTLVTVQLFATLYTPSSTSTSIANRAAVRETRDRLKVFMLVGLTAFSYQFLPSLLFPTLTSVAMLCLVDNKSWWLLTFGSGYNGQGLLNFRFEWSSIGSSGPLFTPYWALGNYFGGLIGMCWIVRSSMLVSELELSIGHARYCIVQLLASPFA